MNKAKLKLKGLQEIKIKILTIFIKKYYHKTKKNVLHVLFTLTSHCVKFWPISQSKFFFYFSILVRTHENK